MTYLQRTKLRLTCRPWPKPASGLRGRHSVRPDRPRRRPRLTDRDPRQAMEEVLTDPAIVARFAEMGGVRSSRRPRGGVRRCQAGRGLDAGGQKANISSSNIPPGAQREEVAPTCGDGGLMGHQSRCSRPSAAYDAAARSPRYAQGGGSSLGAHPGRLDDLLPVWRGRAGWRPSVVDAAADRLEAERDQLLGEQPCPSPVC